MESIATSGYRFSLAVLCALLVLLSLFPAINLSLFHSLNQPFSGFSAILWANITNLGDGLVATVLGIAIFSRIPRHLAAVFLSVIIVGILVQIKKYGFNYLPGTDWLGLRPAGRLGEEAIKIQYPANHGWMIVVGPVQKASVKPVVRLIDAEIDGRGNKQM